ncbi:serine/threonine protein kinase [Actinoplanes teichomyceticus]|uniref:Serine/threonine protein kinase n=2 Tax=Actinoplanes teichomyceticus TaxID=1867 RepID=A0A561WPJ9_ACTTI|nr:serine/threonine protein kinase [Actinoplanes teichomyceticus]GIF10870.1 hypothetical protein Ate01nite_09020 [Actinoplanes teichomyceticus]
MGRVWRATDVVLHREVAIKELVPPPGLTPAERQEMRERSLREARAIARLNNINVVRVFDVLRTDADPWIVMEYVPSRSLQDTIAADGPFNPVRAAEIGLGVLNALKAAHRAGVVHRDIKPGNVLIGGDGRVVLTDFGLATVPGDPNVTRTGLVLGSPAYIAPERARDGTAGPAADLWSLGATLYAAVEGQSPFARPSAIATLAALATENVPQARNAGPLKPVLNGLLRKDPAHRIDADEAERLLARAAGRRSKLSFPMSPTMRRPGVGRERPSLPSGPGGPPVLPGSGFVTATGSAPVVPTPRPPGSPRPADPPSRSQSGNPGRPTIPPVPPGRPVFAPGKATVGNPVPPAPPARPGHRPLDATKVDAPPVRDEPPAPPGSRQPGNLSGTRGPGNPSGTHGPGNPPGQAGGLSGVRQPGDLPGARGPENLSGTRQTPPAGPRGVRPVSGRATPVEPSSPVVNTARVGFTAADVAANRRKQAAPEHERSLAAATGAFPVVPAEQSTPDQATAVVRKPAAEPQPASAPGGPAAKGVDTGSAATGAPAQSSSATAPSATAPNVTAPSATAPTSTAPSATAPSAEVSAPVAADAATPAAEAEVAGPTDRSGETGKAAAPAAEPTGAGKPDMPAGAPAASASASASAERAAGSTDDAATTPEAGAGGAKAEPSAAGSQTAGSGTGDAAPAARSDDAERPAADDKAAPGTPADPAAPTEPEPPAEADEPQAAEAPRASGAKTADAETAAGATDPKASAETTAPEPAARIAAQESPAQVEPKSPAPVAAPEPAVPAAAPPPAAPEPTAPEPTAPEPAALTAAPQPAALAAAPGPAAPEPSAQTGTPSSPVQPAAPEQPTPTAAPSTAAGSTAAASTAAASAAASTAAPKPAAPAAAASTATPTAAPKAAAAITEPGTAAAIPATAAPQIPEVEPDADTVVEAKSVTPGARPAAASAEPKTAKVPERPVTPLTPGRRPVPAVSDEDRTSVVDLTRVVPQSPAAPADGATRVVPPLAGFTPSNRPAWNPMPVRPAARPVGGVTVFGTTLTRRQAVIGAAIVLTFLLLVGIIVVQAFGDGDEQTGGTTPSAVSTGKPAPTQSSGRTGGNAPAPKPSTTPSTVRPSSAAAAGVPANWRTTSLSGYSVALPPEAEFDSRGGQETRVKWNNRLLIIFRFDGDQGDPVKAFQGADHGGFSGESIKPVTFQGRSAADWEYFYNTGSGNRLHVLKRGFSVDGKTFHICWYTPPDDWDAGRKDLDAIFASFKVD